MVRHTKCRMDRNAWIKTERTL